MRHERAICGQETKALQHNPRKNFGITKEADKTKPKQTSRTINWNFALFFLCWWQDVVNRQHKLASVAHSLSNAQVRLVTDKNNSITKVVEELKKNYSTIHRVTAKTQSSKYNMVNWCNLPQNSMFCTPIFTSSFVLPIVYKMQNIASMTHHAVKSNHSDFMHNQIVQLWKYL